MTDTSNQNTIYALCVDNDFVLHFDTRQEAYHYREKFNRGKQIYSVEKTPEIEEHRGLQDRLLKIKMDRLEKSNENKNNWEDVYIASCYLNNSMFQMEAAMGWIEHMDSKEFQDRLLEDALPAFTRSKPPIAKCPIERMTNHAYLLMTDECHRVGLYNQGYLHRHELRYYDVDYFKRKYYNEFKQMDDYEHWNCYK